MKKITINLTSGNVVEKPLISGFKGTNGNYAVLDNEAVGNYGYPIICVCKYKDDGSFEKIINQEEWSAVKENLKSIISGAPMTYVDVPDRLTAPDEFYTQLTLQPNAFDALKSNYIVPYVAPAAPEIPVAPVVPEMQSAQVMPEISPLPVVEPAPVAPIEVTPVASMPVETPAIEPAPEFDFNLPNIDIPAIPAEPVQVAPVSPEPITTTPVEQVSIEMPAMPEINIQMPVPDEAPSAPITTIDTPTQTVSIAPTPVVEQTLPEMPVVDMPMPEVGEPIDDIANIKATFMAACENMFDALVSQINNQ